MTKLGNQIAKENYQEELVFEQILMTDNPPTRNLVIIDRQVEDHVSSKKLDVLALTRPSGKGAFNFLVIEVKLGKNKELRNSVASQLNGYVVHIQNHIDDYIACYERNYAQKYQLGLMDYDDLKPTVEIAPIVEGIVVVGGYSGLASEAITELKINHPDIQVKEMRNLLS